MAGTCPSYLSTRIRKLGCTVPFQSIRLQPLRPNLRGNRTVRLRIASRWASSPSQVTPHPARFPMKCIGTAGHPLPKGEGCAENRSDSCPLPWGEGGERSEPGEGSFPFSEGRTPTQLANSGSTLLREFPCARDVPSRLTDPSGSQGPLKMRSHIV